MAEAGSSKSASVSKRPFEELNVEIQGAALNTTKLAAALPSDISFHRSVDNDYAKALDACSDKALALANRLLSLLSSADSSRTSRSKGKYKFEDEDDVTDNFRTVAIDALDLSLERADTCLDQHLGRSKPAAVAINPKPIPKKAAAGRLDHALTHAAHLSKPQLRFKKKVDNFSAVQWIPSLRHKYNAKVPFRLNLRVASDIEGFDSDSSNAHPYEHEIRNLSYPRRMFERSDVVPPRSFEDTPFTWVDSPSSFNAMLEKLRAARELAVDLEHHSFRTFSGFLCLMQISTREEDFVVDTLALREELEELNEVFTDPEIVKIFHGAESDIIWLQQDFNLYIVNLFDTYHASKVLNFPKHGLASLLEMYCDFIPDKRYQLADWRIRPLPDEMLQYARSDTHFLIYIYDNLRNALLDRDLNTSDSTEPLNSLRTVLDRSQETALRTYRREIYDYETGQGPGGWDALAQKWNKALNGVNLEVYRSVHHWRDKIAREEDESTKYVLPNHYLFQLADHPPADMAALLSLFRPVPPLIKTKAASLLDCIRAAVKRASTADGLVPSDSTPKVTEVGKAPQQAEPEAMEVEIEPNPSQSTPSQLPSRMWSSQRSDTIIASSSSLLASLISHSSSITSLASASSPNSPAPTLFPILKSIGSTILKPSSRYLEVMHKIHGALMVVPSAPKVLPEASTNEEKSVAVPESVEEIPFIPASQRQGASISTNHEVDNIVVVGQRQKKRKRVKTAATEESASWTKKAKSSEPSPEADISQKEEESFDFASEPNFLDTIPVPANSAKTSKAKGKGKKGRAVEFGDFPAPPRAFNEVKSGNKSHTFRK